MLTAAADSGFFPRHLFVTHSVRWVIFDEIDRPSCPADLSQANPFLTEDH
jgi:hypothetical protein